MSFFSAPKMPAPPPLPPAPPPIPTPVDPAITGVRENIRRRQAASGGRGKTIATSAQGLSTEAQTTNKSLLGQ